MKYDDPNPRPEDEELEVGSEGPGEGDEDGEGATELAEEEEPVEAAAEEDDVDLEEEEPVRAPPKGKSKDENMAALRERARMAQERADRLEREAAELRTRVQPQQQTEDPRREAERLARMTPEQRVQHYAAVAEERIARATAIGEFQAADQADKASFAVRTAHDPRAAKYAPEVEARLLQLRKSGANASREDVLKYIIGERVMANMPKVKKQQAAARETVRSQTTNPERPKGDTGGKRRVDEKTARAKRLDGVRI